MADLEPSAHPGRLGRLVRLRSLKPSELPAHPDLGPQQSTTKCPDLINFLAEALNESENFMAGYLPANFKSRSKDKISPPAAAKIELLEREVNGGETNSVHPTIPASRTSETWFARRSVHENVAKDGTADWAEFDDGLRKDHSQHEMEYTPDVKDAHLVLNWDDMIIEKAGPEMQVSEWQEVQMSLMEMVHHIPPPLNNRVFNVIVITAKHISGGKILVVQIPVNTTNMAGAKYHAGKSDSPTQGIYCSIERGEIIDGMASVKWEMATASDAKGALPMFVQKMGTPAAVVKDVGLFMEWCAQRRAGSP